MICNAVPARIVIYHRDTITHDYTAYVWHNGYSPPKLTEELFQLKTLGEMWANTDYCKQFTLQEFVNKIMAP